MNEIQTVKIQGSGWLLNNVMHVPGNAPGNSEYELIKQWLSEGNTPEPEFTELEIIAKNEATFRAERNALISKVDIEINKAEDLGISSLLLREYRQALRDATIDWILPESVM